MSNHRSHGRPTPSRGARFERRKAERGPKQPVARMAIPDAIRALSTTPPRPEGARRG